jgi:signal transduction histidine kinase
LISCKRHIAFGIFLLLGLFMGSSLYAQDSGQIREEFDAHIAAARSYRNQDKIVLALEALDKAASWAEDNLDEKALIDSYHHLALLNLEIGKIEAAMLYWERVTPMLSNVGYPYGIAVYKYIEAKLRFLEGNNFQAINKLLEAKKESNDRNLLNLITLLEGDIYRVIGKFDTAKTNYNSLLVNTDPYEKDYLKTKAYLGLSLLNREEEDLQSSIENARSALEIARTNEFSKEVLQANELLTELYERSGQYSEALIHIQNIQRLRDSLYTVSKLKVETSKSDSVQINFMTEQLKQQDEQILRLSESANRSEITAILTSAFLTIISLLAVSLYRNNQIKLKTNDLLQTKNRELQAARDSAVMAMEAKTNFLSTVSHELRTPLYAVTGLTHLLLEENPSEAQKEHLKALKFSGDYLLNFINDILQINKIDADKLEPMEVEFNLKKVLTEVMNSLQQTAKENQTELILDYDPQIPGPLMSDPLKLSQIFMNLVGNALKFTKQGEVLVLAKLIKLEDDVAHLYFEVRDDGIGIDKEQQEHIFDSFEQGSIQINREYGGTGLGLTIVKSLLGLFGSQIKLESEPGKGSSFYFELQLKCKDNIVDDIPFEIAEKEYEFDGLNVLVVEDNKINQVITKKMLAKKNISCDIANNGTEAISLAKTNPYDGILMDIHMPGISGVEATAAIREFDPDTPIIALTAISLDDSLETFYAAGCNDVVTKPFKPELFYQKIGENIVEHKMKKTLS